MFGGPKVPIWGAGWVPKFNPSAAGHCFLYCAGVLTGLGLRLWVDRLKGG
jgi:hypothetical protein